MNSTNAAIIQKLLKIAPHTERKYTVCPGSSDPFYIVTYQIKWVTTSWTHSMNSTNAAIIQKLLKLITHRGNILYVQEVVTHFI